MEDATARLARAGVPEPRLDAELLLAWLLGTGRLEVVLRRPDPLEPAVAERYSEMLRRREGREPLQYVLGSSEFYGLELAVDRRVLVPRPETEGLVDAVLAVPPPEGGRVLDVGTGSGCIAIALAATRHDLTIRAIDTSEDALEVARANVERHRLAGRIELGIAGIAELGAAGTGLWDVVVSNPPYVAEAEWAGLQPEVRDFEPKAALVPGPTGLEAYEALAGPALSVLRPRGTLVVELGYGQADRVAEIARAAGFSDIEVLPDLRGIRRVLRARKPERE